MSVSVIPAKAGIHAFGYIFWIPVFTGMTREESRNSRYGNSPSTEPFKASLRARFVIRNPLEDSWAYNNKKRRT
ncbi:MAG: hypothetical protein COV91_03705 [Candidatus Taylorbacteria bacterium CG11_big_fil_rev_8_21_14_0_20_46_11]|uniref:Uncharacterized protein n=1 Tax=Candidatus Taylorbacteria bacterium CG11_big_fil_rev_8_21_14_0_20_46_11 TaxID=1975025 RepID=A0A2H0KD82_9BACT|nr:MAG: hypothetical protein COV91_03705 [Candidatus Taylorbacteria bacterium CG11_big_fil_rev_8_21_14_0_20_46_11]